MSEGISKKAERGGGHQLRSDIELMRYMLENAEIEFTEFDILDGPEESYSGIEMDGNIVAKFTMSGELLGFEQTR